MAECPTSPGWRTQRQPEPVFAQGELSSSPCLKRVFSARLAGLARARRPKPFGLFSVMSGNFKSHVCMIHGQLDPQGTLYAVGCEAGTSFNLNQNPRPRGSAMIPEDYHYQAFKYGADMVFQPHVVQTCRVFHGFRGPRYHAPKRNCLQEAICIKCVCVSVCKNVRCSPNEIQRLTKSCK